MGENWKKVLCSTCITSLVKEESASVCDDLVASVKKELYATIQTFRDSLVNPAASQPSTSEASQGSISFPMVEALPEGPSIREEQSPTPSVKDSEEEGEEAEVAPSKFKLSLEEVDGLLKAIHVTLGLSEEKKELSLHDRMYAGLNEPKGRTFPVHSVISDAITKEWQDPEKKPFFSRAHKRRFPFEEDPSAVWHKVPWLDAAFSQVSRSTDLSFEDMGVLKDPMDKRMDLLLNRSWQSIMSNLKPAMATTCVARNLEYWVNQLRSHIVADSPKQEILDSFPTLISAVAYIVGASAEAIKMSARSAALTNDARRALWLKTWPGDTASKNQLCGIPFSGDLLFWP
ncbi:lamina-associated polypeptide 2, isoforms alpha/zeta-like [Aquarana catesbeiana]|uniref:lamina-associated polypeptide 2, isoforms alpha/zeta-like n=1 Tax=Aquarana catesbeiana TaxID=8400 RepID=UPI003CC9C010